MTQTPKIAEAVYVLVDDWNGLYIDGKLVGEGDSMNLPYLLDGKTVQFDIRDSEADSNYIDNGGGFPETWDELIDHQYMWDEDHRDYDEDEDDE